MACSLLTIALWLMASTVMSAPATSETTASPQQLYKAYLASLVGGELSSTRAPGKKVPFVDKSSFEEALKAGMLIEY